MHDPSEYPPQFAQLWHCKQCRADITGSLLFFPQPHTVQEVPLMNCWKSLQSCCVCQHRRPFVTARIRHECLRLCLNSQAWSDFKDAPSACDVISWLFSRYKPGSTCIMSNGSEWVWETTSNSVCVYPEALLIHCPLPLHPRTDFTATFLQCETWWRSQLHTRPTGKTQEGVRGRITLRDKQPKQIKHDTASDGNTGETIHLFYWGWD